VRGASGQPKAEISEDSPAGPLLDIDAHGVPFGFAQGRLSTARDRPSDAHAPLEMTEQRWA